MYKHCKKSCSSKTLVNKWYSQHHQAGEVGEGVVRDAADAVECQRERLQVPLMLQRHDWNLGQTVIIQPQVPELLQALETVLRHHCDVVRIQAPGERQARVKSTVFLILYTQEHSRKKYHESGVELGACRICILISISSRNTANKRRIECIIYY